MSKNSTSPFSLGLCRILGMIVILFLPVFVGAQDAATTSESSTNGADQSATKADKGESKSLADNFKFIFEIGGQYVDLSGDRPTKFEEFQRVRKGFTLPRFRIASNPAGSPDFFRAIGRGATETDQQYFVDFGRYGTYRTTFQYTGTQHLFSDGGKTLFSGGRGIITVPDSIQTTLQNTPDASVPAVVQGLYASASTIRIQSKRHTMSFNQTFQATKEWSIRFNWTRNSRVGLTPLGIGSYERIGTPAGDTFLVHSIEAPNEVDYVTDQLTFGTRYLKEKWGFSFDYVYSNFKNAIPSLIYDNPFRITDFEATSSGNFNRQKFARGSFANAPGNTAQSIAISGFVDLPYNTRAAAALGWSFGRQSEQFVPYTLNSAIVTGVPVGLNITSASSLPKQNLDGQVDTFTQDYVIATHPWKSFTFNARFRRYDNEVKTAQILFPGYAATGESFWRSNISGLPIITEARSFVKSNFGVEAIFDINKAISWKFGYEWEGWDRHHRQAARTNEHSFSTLLKFKPVAQFNSRISYKYSDKKPEFYSSGILEYSGLRMFDQAARKRHDFTWQWQWAIDPRVGVSGTVGYLDDSYDKNFFGLVKYTQWNGTFDVMYMPKDNFTFYANYSRENYKNAIQTIAKNATPWDLNNRWNREEQDVLDNFGIGFTTFAMKDKLLLDLNYVYSNANTQTTTVNPGVPAANTVLSATAFPFPDVKSRLQEFNSDISYQFGERWGLGFRYKYQPYTLDDFALNNLSPYPINNLPVEQDGRRFLLLDSRYSSHNAHLITVYLTVK